MKKCFRCGIPKELDEFYKHPQMPGGHVNKCKECNKKDVRKNYVNNKTYYNEYDKKRQRHDKKRIFDHRYTQIIQRVEGRATRMYKVLGSKCLNRDEYNQWLLDNMNKFDELYKEWMSCGFSRSKTPSIDRIDNTLGYTPENMRWVSLSDNSSKGSK